MEVLNRVKQKNVEDGRKELHRLFNEQGYSDYMVVYLRLLTSGQLQIDQDIYSNFIEGNRTVSICNILVYFLFIVFYNQN